jgi:hypothetical protein
MTGSEADGGGSVGVVEADSCRAVVCCVAFDFDLEGLGL